MTVSELIEALEKVKETVGDAEVAIINDRDIIHSFQVSVVAGYDYGDVIRYPEDVEEDDDIEGTPMIVGISDL